MTDYEKIADLLFGQELKTPEDYEALYPPRALAEGQRVTRLAPSPTGCGCVQWRVLRSH